MARKHPERHRIVPAAMPGGGQPPHAIAVHLEETFRTLPRRRGTGVSGLPNEYLRALIGTFDDAQADRVMPAYDAFASAAANVSFPSWFYSAWAIAGLNPLVKAQLSPDQRAAGEDPDCRPVAVGESTLRAIARQLTEECAVPASEELRPQQVAVGVSGGLSVMIHGVRLLLEQRGDFVVVRLDMRNAYNAASRAVLLRRLAEQPRLAHLAPFMHALSAGATDLLLGAMHQRLFPGTARGDSSEGTQQGLPPSSMIFCVGVHPELRCLSAELEPFGGCARATSDDVYAMGPAHAVFPAVARFAARLREMLDLEVQHHKSCCWSRHYDLDTCPWREQSGIPVGTVIVGDDLGGPVAEGVIVGGVPMGTPAFVAEHMRREASDIVSYIQTTVTQLQHSPHALWAALYYSCSHKFDYWLRHMPPVEVADAAAQIDAAMLVAVDTIGYAGMMVDDIARRRLRLPARMRGCGIRQLTALAPIAYCACFVESVEVMFDVPGVPGFFNMLAPAFGDGAFEGGHRFTTFLQSATPSAQAFRGAWGALRMQVGLDPAVADAGQSALAQLAEMAGADRSSERLQRAITAQVEQCERDALHAVIMALPLGDPRREAWMAEDRLSSQWVSSWPGLPGQLQPALGDAEMPEVLTTYLGMESPAVRGLGGRSIPCGRGARICDPHGRQLGLATLPGAVFTIVHDGCSGELFRIMREAGLYTEIEPRHILNTLLPAHYLLRPGQPPSIVPDARVDAPLPPAPTTRREAVAARCRNGVEAAHERPLLLDAKTLFAGGGIYRTPSARDDQSGAVEERARQVPREYLAHAARLDTRFHGAGSTLIRDRIASFGPTRGVIFGNYGEASRDVHTLLHISATRLARRHWRSMGARTESEARSFYVARLRRRMGVAAVREFARHRLRRVPYVGVPRAVVEQRMQREALRNRMAGDPLAEPPYADFFAFQAGPGGGRDGA